jgi:hypothetical protein
MVMFVKVVLETKMVPESVMLKMCAAEKVRFSNMQRDKTTDPRETRKRETPTEQDNSNHKERNKPNKVCSV